MAKTYVGFYKAIVSNTNDPEKRGRLKCLIPDVLGDSVESAWCEPCVPVAYDNGGDFCLPQKNETVWVTFDKGDMNFPIYLGGWWRKNSTPLGSDYSDREKVRIISYEDCIILMKSGVIDILVGGSDTTIEIKEGKAIIKGDLSVTGNITVSKNITVSGDVNVSGEVTASNIE